MAQPETREVNRCTYTPVVNSAEVDDNDPTFTARQPFAVLALLRTALGDAQIGAAVLDELAASGGVSEYADALRRAWNGDTAGAVQALATLAPASAIAFAHQALDTQQSLLERTDTELKLAATQLLQTADSDQLDEDELLGALSANAPTLGRLTAALRPLTPTRPAPPRPPESESTPQAESDEEADNPAEAEVHVFAADDPEERATGRAAVPNLAALRPTPAPPLRLDPQRIPAVSRLTQALLAARADLQRRRDVLRTVDFLGASEPMGFLHLERMQFTPEGYVRGDLVYSLPLVPGETVRLTHREWSRTETDFASLVSTSLETAQQDTLSEKSELTESVTAQQQHNSAFTSSVTASGGFGPVNISSSVGYNVSNADTNSRTQSSRHAQEITKSASSRTKKEHKLSFRVTTTREVEDVSFRELTNTTDNAVRWDFHRLMKKWRIDLYRYDVRLTYDLILPEPGSYLLRAYQELARIDEALRRPFRLRGISRLGFTGNPAQISPRNWQTLAAAYRVSLEPPPPRRVHVQAHAEQVFSEELVGTDYVSVAMPDGYHIRQIRLDSFHPHVSNTDGVLLGHIDPRIAQNRANLRLGQFQTYEWRYDYDWSERAQPPQGTVLSIGLTATGMRGRRLLQTWQQDCFQRILDAARTRFETGQQALAARREELVAQLDREDGLALRKMEREEIQKGVLRWVLGDRFTFYPPRLPDLDPDADDDLALYSSQTGRVRTGLLDPDRLGGLMARYAQQIRFLQHAIEWENVNYVLYPYFWTDPDRWDLKQGLFHPDFEHRTFLRAGAARVVLTLRPSYEKAFLSFMETGRLDRLLDADHKYLTVAEELKAYASENNRYTSAANEEDPRNHVDTWYEFTPTGALDVVAGTVLGDDGPA